MAGRRTSEQHEFDPVEAEEFEPMEAKQEHPEEMSESSTPTSMADSPPSGPTVGSNDDGDDQPTGEESLEGQAGGDLAVNRAGGDETF